MLGYVYSSEQRTLTADNREIGLTIEQTITFEECEADDINTDASLTAMRVNTTYAYSIYELSGEILRYAMVTSVGPDAGRAPSTCDDYTTLSFQVVLPLIVFHNYLTPFIYP